MARWSPWITPPPQQWTSVPASVALTYRYGSSIVSMADVLSGPMSTVSTSPTLAWLHDGPTGDFTFAAGAVAPSPASGFYAAENGSGAPGFYNANPTWPTDATDIEHETVWNSHTQSGEMLASIVGDMQFTAGLEDRAAVTTPTDCTVYFWLEDPANIIAGPDTAHGETIRTAGSPTQTELLAGYTARIGEVALPASTPTGSVTLDLPTSSFSTVLVADRPDEAPGVYVNLAILEGAQGTDPPLPAPGNVTGREVFFASTSLTVTYQPPRYRFLLVGSPPLRQWPRDDGLRRTPARQGSSPTSRQGSLRRGPAGSYQ